MTPTQISLWDIPADPMVRSDSRETSRAAAASVEKNHREAECIDALRYLAVASSTYDIQQVLATYGLHRDRNCLSRRLLSLVRKGLVDDRGMKPGPHGRQVTAYRLSGGAS